MTMHQDTPTPARPQNWTLLPHSTHMQTSTPSQVPEGRGQVLACVHGTVGWPVRHRKDLVRQGGNGTVGWPGRHRKDLVRQGGHYTSLCQCLDSCHAVFRHEVDVVISVAGSRLLPWLMRPGLPQATWTVTRSVGNRSERSAWMFRFGECSESLSNVATYSSDLVGVHHYGKNTTHCTDYLRQHPLVQ